jgi:predicted nucleotidyltransferase
MTYLHEFASKSNLPKEKLSPSEVFSVYYHNIFGYPLTFSELIKWAPRNPPAVEGEIDIKDGFYFIKGSEGLIYKRTLRRRSSQDKIRIAKKACRIISIIPTVMMIGITGSLAMENAGPESDIDLIIITKKGRLWTTRAAVYLVLRLSGIPLRKPRSAKQRDRLCLNLWLDESDMSWSRGERNFYTAHEILQIIPLVNKKQTFERFLLKNRWVLDFWPNAAELKIKKDNTSYTKQRNINLVEHLAYKVQYLYMSKKVTNEVVKPTRAIFHPHNFSKKIYGIL